MSPRVFLRASVDCGLDLRNPIGISDSGSAFSGCGYFIIRPPHTEVHLQVVRAKGGLAAGVEGDEVFAEPELIEGENRQPVAPGFLEAFGVRVVGEGKMFLPCIESARSGRGIEIAEDEAVLLW